MSLAPAYANLATTLSTDAGILAWAPVAAKALTVLYGNRDVQAIDPAQLPALVLEAGNLPLELVVGGHVEQGTHEMHASFVWHNESEASGFAEKLDLVELVPKAVLADSTLGGAVDGAAVTGIVPDLGYNFPRHSVRITVSAGITITR